VVEDTSGMLEIGAFIKGGGLGETNGVVGCSGSMWSDFWLEVITCRWCRTGLTSRRLVMETSGRRFGG
jgi:hypothetical protein